MEPTIEQLAQMLREQMLVAQNNLYTLEIMVDDDQHIMLDEAGLKREIANLIAFNKA